jgi:hypothetical protein
MRQPDEEPARRSFSERRRIDPLDEQRICQAERRREQEVRRQADRVRDAT